MNNVSKLLFVFLIAGVLISGCQSEKGIIQPGTAGQDFSGANVALVTIDSAIFSIYVTNNNGQTVNVHRITAAWAEDSVTWNNFGQAFSPSVDVSFIADAQGFESANVTALVQGWIDGTYPNYGLLLDQGLTPLTMYCSSETSQVEIRPMLRIFVGADIFIFQRGTNGDVADTYIRQNMPDVNFGSGIPLYSGAVEQTLKQTLVRFDICVQPPPEEGCTRTIGYWKNHAGFGPQANVVTPLLPIWLGIADSSASLHVTDSLIAYNVLRMRTYGVPSNGITKLYAQLLAAKLNIANDASDDDIAAVIISADAFLAIYDYSDWATLERSDRQMVLEWMGILGEYNEGIIGPGHCDDARD